MLRNGIGVRLDLCPRAAGLSVLSVRCYGVFSQSTRKRASVSDAVRK